MRVMKVRERNLSFEIYDQACLKQVMGNRFRKGNYSHVQYKGRLYKCTSVKRDLIPNKIVWVNGLNR
jgi:hypothetical protein